MGKDARERLREAVRAIAWTARILERSCTEVSLPQYRVLALIAIAPGRASALADRASVTKPALTSLIDSLVERGLVERSHVHGDRRGVLLGLTDDGHRAVHDAEEAMVARLEQTLSHLAAPEDAVAGLAALRRALEAEANALFTEKPVGST